jgi:SAM-dependent methyltransferase
MTRTDRLKNERVFHDRQARRRARDFAERPDRLVFSDGDYLDHESWIRPAFEGLGDVDGKRVLDFGCGHGMAAVVLARRGASVTAFDLSHGYLEEARKRAHANRVYVHFAIADGEYLPFADHSFDRIWGCAILHHLDIRRAGPELFRVLKPGGLAVFCEPWGENPLLSWARHNLPYWGKERTPDEQPMRRSQVRFLQSLFSNVEHKGFQLLSMARRILLPVPVHNGLDWCDRQLLTRMPRLQNFCRYAVLSLGRQPK